VADAGKTAEDAGKAVVNAAEKAGEAVVNGAEKAGQAVGNAVGGLFGRKRK
jgi:hypothetical protein